MLLHVGQQRVTLEGWNEPQVIILYYRYVSHTGNTYGSKGVVEINKVAFTLQVGCVYY